MADDLKTETARLRALLQGLLHRVPPSVLGGSYNTAVNYKKVAGQAHKLLASAAPKFALLQQAYTQLCAFH